MRARPWRLHGARAGRAGAKCCPTPTRARCRAYTLTEAAFAKYVTATHKLRDIKFENCVDDDDDDAQDTIASSVARIDAVPGAKAAVQSAGMTSREYVVLSYALHARTASPRT